MVGWRWFSWWENIPPEYNCKGEKCSIYNAKCSCICKTRKTKEDGGIIYNLLGDIWLSKTVSWTRKGVKKQEMEGIAIFIVSFMKMMFFLLGGRAIFFKILSVRPSKIKPLLPKSLSFTSYPLHGLKLNVENWSPLMFSQFFLLEQYC